MSQTHFPSTLNSQSASMNHHHVDSKLLGIPHSSPSSMEATAAAPNSFSSTPQRKFTLLSRPQQQQLTSSVSISYQSSMSSPDTYNGQVIEANPSLNQSSLLPPSGSVQGRATRVPTHNEKMNTDDYYDTEDPSVNLQDFIVNSMQAQKNRVILMKLEEEFISYIADQNRTDPMKLPPWDSYHRMLAHRVAAYFGLEHNVDPMDKTRVIVGKGPNTRLPQARFGDYLSLSLNEDSESPEPKLILKRAPSNTTSVDKPFGNALASVGSSSDVKLGKSYEEREEEYEKARARIFDQPSPLQSIVSFDLATQSSPRLSSSILHSAMHHRRAASDTAMFKRLAPAEAKKEGSSSSQGSRSTTPLVSSMLRPAGSCELHFPSFSSQVQPPLQSKTSPKSIQQQQVHSISSFDKPSQSSLFFPQTTSSVIVSSSSPSKFHTSSNSQAQHSNEQSHTTTVTATSPTALHFQPVQQQLPHQQQQAAIPMMYGHPQHTHPQAAMMADPWYYQQMMVYQMTPQGYIQTPYVGGASPHMIPGPVYHPYSMAPGVLNQHGIMSPPVTSQQQQLGSVGTIPRVPVPLEQLQNPAHHNSAAAVALVKPVPQQASPVRVAKLDGSWNYSPGSGPSYNMAQHPMMAQPVAMSPGTAGPNSVAPVSANQVAEQLENSLHISSSASDSFAPEGEAEAVISRDPSAVNSQAKVKYTEANDVDSAMMGQPMMSRMTNGPFPVGTLPLTGDQAAMYGGHLISPTQGPLQFIPSQTTLYGANTQEGPGFVGNQQMLPNSAIHLSAGNPSQPSTPTMGGINLGPAMLQQQGIFSPPTSAITHSPVQILGHTLGTSLFSPPPSTGNQHGLFINSPTSTGKMGYTPTHPPVGSVDVRMRPYDSPKHTGSHISEVSASMTAQTVNGYQTLPPRLAQQQHVQKSGNRYQNQRHPSNRTKNSQGAVTLGDHLPSQFVSTMNPPSGTSGFSSKREPLLPTPPPTQMVKLDTNLTCGVPLHVMEVVGCPPEGSPDRAQAQNLISNITGVTSIKSGKMAKTGEEVTIAIFSSQEAAMQALKIKFPHLSLSIPRNNHAKFILTML